MRAFQRIARLCSCYFWVVFTTTRSPQSKLFRSTVFGSSRQLQANTTEPVRVQDAPWASACERHLAEGLRRRGLPSWLGDGKGAG